LWFPAFFTAPFCRYCDAKGYHVERLDGRVAGKDRLKAMDRFNG